MTLRGLLEAATARRTILALELVLIAGTTFLAALVFWLLIGPLRDPPIAIASVPEPSVVEIAGPINPFRSAGVSAAAVSDLEIGPDLAETSLNMTLHGTWIDNEGGSAIISTPAGEQKRFHAGEKVWENVSLERVYRDQVVISRGGVRESLRLINRDALTMRSVTPVATGADMSAVGLMQIGDLVTAIPQTDSVGGVRLVLQPSRDKDSFFKLGLRPGDILVAVDNQRVGPDIAQAIENLRSLAGRGTVEVSVERGGVVLPVRIQLDDRATREEGEPENEG